MRRLLAIAAFALLLAVPLWAQHGGGHSGGGHAGGSGGHTGFSGGGHSGFSGGHGSGGGHASAGMRSAPGARRGFSQSHALSQRGFSHQSFRNPGFRNNGFRNNRFRGRNGLRTFGFRNNCYGYACRGYGYPWGYGGYYDPYWWDSGSSYDDSYQRDRATANDMNAQSLDEQRMLRQEEADGDQDSHADSRGGRLPDSQGVANGSPIAPPTVLVFRDQHKQEIRNYAIVGQTLWNFSPQRTEKIPISDLDLTATSKANDDRGLSFHVPDSAQAQ